ncbi:hypothetical protein IMZ48_12240 [Candidatus Bathyarchaeota archaeon]|nr:hypothetical protein [Candidatus Bathyarchaeota archaeon]
MPYPDIFRWGEEWKKPHQDDPNSDYATRIIQSYQAQLYLRKHLNRIHREVYSGNTSNGDRRRMLRNLEYIQSDVEGMSWVAPAYRFQESDDPANDILSARLRAKYWGAQVITYRPCIKMILDLSFELRSSKAAATGQVVQVFEEPAQDVRDAVLAFGGEVHNHARKGVRALIESTQAFHGLDGDDQPPMRPIITNVFGTAHA